VCRVPITRRSLLLILALGLLPARRTHAATPATPYRGPLIDAHSHLPNLQVLETLISAMDRHRIARVTLLGVGGVQKDDVAWIQAAARRFPDRIIAFAPVPDPMAADAANSTGPADILAAAGIGGEDPAPIPPQLLP